MHRHSYIGKKFSRKAAPRRAMMRNLLDSLILYERIETTEIKAKELAREFDKLVTKAKRADLHNYRQILAKTINPVAAEKLNVELVNGFQSRNSGYSRVIKVGRRLGDGAEMAVVELILDDSYVANASRNEKKTDKITKQAQPKVKASQSAKKVSSKEVSK